MSSWRRRQPCIVAAPASHCLPAALPKMTVESGSRTWVRRSCAGEGASMPAPAVAAAAGAGGGGVEGSGAASCALSRRACSKW
eukprot:4447108-Alexandrium_andersonii.AAC.1